MRYTCEPCKVMHCTKSVIEFPLKVVGAYTTVKMHNRSHVLPAIDRYSKENLKDILLFQYYSKNTAKPKG